MRMIKVFGLCMIMFASVLFASTDVHAKKCHEIRCGNGAVHRLDDNNDMNSCYCAPAESNNCANEVQSLMQDCNTQIQDTSYTCDEKNDSGMSGVANTASQLALMFGQQTAGSIQAACSKMAAFSSAANAAVAAYRLTCQSSIGSCHSACGRVVEYISANGPCLDAMRGPGSAGQLKASAENTAERCSNYDAKVREADQAIKNFSSTMRNAAQCASLTSGHSTALPEICKTNPTLPGCNGATATDCTNPELAGSKICICSKNPSDPACMSVSGESAPAFMNSANSGSRLAATGLGGPGGDLPALPSVFPGKPGSGGAGEAVDGKQGGSAGISSSGGGGGGAGGGTGGDSLEEGVQVTAGFYGGGGTFGGSAGMGAGGARSGAGKRGAAKGQGDPDLRKFLPGGQYDPKLRGIAGNGGPDGITGPHSNIWQKIQNRYRVMWPTLLP